MSLSPPAGLKGGFLNIFFHHGFLARNPFLLWFRVVEDIGLPKELCSGMWWMTAMLPDAALFVNYGFQVQLVILETDAQPAIIGH